jgi:hypothetical protein
MSIVKPKKPKFVFQTTEVVESKGDRAAQLGKIGSSTFNRKRQCIEIRMTISIKQSGVRGRRNRLRQFPQLIFHATKIVAQIFNNRTINELIL